MKSVLKIALLTGCSLGSLWATPVDFTPRPYDLELDGVVFRDVRFLQGSNQICYRPPQGWAASGFPERACFQPGGGSSVRMEFTHMDGSSAPTWDEEGLNALRQRARAVLPPAGNIKLIGELRSPLRINGHDTIIFNFSGSLFSQNYKFSVLLLPLESEQFNFLLYATEKEFDIPSKQFLNSLFGLQWKSAQKE